MSDLNFYDQYVDEITSACLGYGYGILNCTYAMFWMKGLVERDPILLVVLGVSALPVTACYNGLLKFLDLMGKDDGEKRRRYETCFKTASYLGFVEFALLFKFFMLG